MGFIGGDISEITCNHPTLGNFSYEVKSGESATLDKGGIRNDDSADGITGAGTVILKKTRVRWSMDSNISVDLLSDDQQSTLNAYAESSDPGVWTFSHISGSIKKGTGWPVGDLNADTGAANMKLKVAGGGNLEEIA